MTSSEEILFTRIGRIGPRDSRSSSIRLQDIGETWNLAETFRSAVSKTIRTEFRVPKAIKFDVMNLSSAFLGEPPLENLVQASRVCDNDDKLLDLYLSFMRKYHARHIPHVERSWSGVVELCLEFDDWQAAHIDFPQADYWYISELGRSWRHKIFKEWRENDGTWTYFTDQWPDNSNQILYFRSYVWQLL